MSKLRKYEQTTLEIIIEKAFYQYNENVRVRGHLPDSTSP